MNYRIALGADHRGFILKEQLRNEKYFGEQSVSWYNVGTDSQERTDYPIFAHRVVEAILSKEVDYGVLICGSGIGESIAANRCAGIYAGLVWSKEVAQVAKEHDNINVLILPADYMNYETAVACIESWLSTSFLGGRYQERLDMIEAYHHQKKEEL